MCSWLFCYFTEKIWKLETLLRKCKESIRRNKERITQLSLENQQLQQTLMDTRVSRNWSCTEKLRIVELNAGWFMENCIYWTVCCSLVFGITCYVNFCFIFGCSGWIWKNVKWKVFLQSLKYLSIICEFDLYCKIVAYFKRRK